MAKDLVCGMSVDEKTAKFKSEHMGKTYYFCSQCEVYTVEIYHDRFLGEDEVSIRGPVPKPEGDARGELIRQCSQPWNKKCRCKAHLAYFQGWLD